jgi:hypothetical protein
VYAQVKRNVMIQKTVLRGIRAGSFLAGQNAVVKGSRAKAMKIILTM